MPLIAKIVRFECEESHIVRNFIRITDLVLKFFCGASGPSASPFPPERHPLLLRVALESGGAVTTQTLHTKTLILMLETIYIVFLMTFLSRFMFKETKCRLYTSFV